MLGDEIHKSTDKQEREKATQKQIGEHEVFSPMTAKKKFNFIFVLQHYRTAGPQLYIALPKFGHKFFQILPDERHWRLSDILIINTYNLLSLKFQIIVRDHLCCGELGFVEVNWRCKTGFLLA